MTGKALLSTTMGELNKENRPWYFEYRLKQILEYATIWKAIVVLDEADVFLEGREEMPTGGAERNALVAGTLYDSLIVALSLTCFPQCSSGILSTSLVLCSSPQIE